MSIKRQVKEIEIKLRELVDHMRKKDFFVAYCSDKEYKVEDIININVNDYFIKGLSKELVTLVNNFDNKTLSYVDEFNYFLFTL